ncbi:MAG: dethiobiotin synthetase [Frankiaceae bacterium]|jgi:dethiobiotin synthetase|nr:dethiobiotin synthetase [Frankiaceae bacterium]
MTAADMTRLVITGTGTEIGKTIMTAAVAALARMHGRSVTVVKPAQTGLAPGEESDIDVVRRLTGVADVHELVRYDDPLAPESAARRQGVDAVPVAELAQRIEQLPAADLLLVEGAGGLLVRFDAAGGTVADLAVALGARVLVVAAAGLGTLNATALTCDAVRARGLDCAGVVIGSWPAAPDLAAYANLDDLPVYARAPLLGRVPAQAGTSTPAEFLRIARAALAPALGGEWSADVPDAGAADCTAP